METKEAREGKEFLKRIVDEGVYKEFLERIVGVEECE